jgi:ABC-type transport system involved in cytochrome c biogenesis permease subunit
MIRHPATTIELAAALAATIYILVATVQDPGHPAVSPAALGAYLALAFGAFVVGLALYATTRLGFPRLLLWWRRRTVRRAVRRLARARVKRMQRRHAARIGGVR